MNILGIESSCDETAAAVVKDGTHVLSSVVSSSHNLHNTFGGILPELASREQLTYIFPVIQQAIQEAFPNDSDITTSITKNIDALAVTIGPGLIGSLLMGIETAKTIAFATKKPLIPVHHVLAHIYGNFIQHPKSNIPNITSMFPAIALIVSGGHTELFHMKSEREMTWLGGTIDDAAGEAFDKTARLLGFGNGGGLAIQQAASNFSVVSSQLSVKLPRPLIHDDNHNFSFSGLKTAVQREWNRNNTLPISDIQHQKSSFAYEVQEAIVDVLVAKTMKAAEQYNVSSILLGGGVSANVRLRQKFQTQQSVIEHQVTVHFPPLEFCTDNAAVIGSYAFYHQLPQNYRIITATPTLSVEVQ